MQRGLLNDVQVELEDQVLTLLAGARGSLLDDSSLIEALDASKRTWESTCTALQVRVCPCILDLTMCATHMPPMTCHITQRCIQPSH